MPGILSPIVSLSLWLLAAADATTPGAVELPRGNDPALRAWTTTSPTEIPAPASVAPAQPRLSSALPRISSRFGRRPDPFKGDRRMHYGIDLPGAQGTRVVASEAGIVRFAGAAGGYGRMVEIGHGNGLSTRYAHLERILVRTGARVERGETIALMGSSGRATGSHLHFELREDGKAVDPVPRLGTRPPTRRTAALPMPQTQTHLSGFARLHAGVSQRNLGSEP